MLDAHQYLERERKRLAEEATALAEAKATILPPKRFAEPPAVPDATARDLRLWQAGILGLIVAFNVGVFFEAVKNRIRRPSEWSILVDEDRVEPLRDIDSGEKVYRIKTDRNDYFPFIDDSLLVGQAAGNLFLFASLAYTRYRMHKLSRTE